MNILKVLGVVVGIHVVAYLIIAQPGCRSTTARSEAAAPAAPAPEAASARPISAAEANTGPGEFSLNLPFAQTQPAGGERSAPTRPGTAAAAEVQPARTYTVVKGDSFALIAHKNGISAADLAAANNTASNATLRPGQKLVIPNKASKLAGSASASAAPAAAPASASGTYTVKSGDTISKIATRHHTTSAALRSLNGLANDNLKIGQTLQVPGAGGAPASRAPAAPAAAAVRTTAPVAAPAAATASASGPAGVHTVAQGESAESIARKYKITVGELARANQLSDPRKIRIGQLLNIPGAGAASAAKPAPSLVPEIASKPAPKAVKTAPAAPVAPAAPLAPAPGADLDAGLPDAAADAPVIRVDEPPPAVPAPQAN